MKSILFFILLLTSVNISFSQKILISWSQKNIENYTKEMYDKAQLLSSSQLLEKNLKDEYWSEVFLTFNAAINNYAKDSNYLKSLTEQLTNKSETKLKGTSRLIIWDRITNGDIIFEGKGLVFENDLFTVAGRANQILQNLSNKNFGIVTIHSNQNDLDILKKRWTDFLNGKAIEELKSNEIENAKIPEISTLAAVKAMIISLQRNPKKDELTKTCLKNIYKLDEMPNEKSSPASYCNPDTYTLSFLGMLFGDLQYDETNTAKWWLDFWNKNQNNFVWNTAKGIYEIKK